MKVRSISFFFAPRFAFALATLVLVQAGPIAHGAFTGGWHSAISSARKAMNHQPNAAPVIPFGSDPTSTSIEVQGGTIPDFSVVFTIDSTELVFSSDAFLAPGSFEGQLISFEGTAPIIYAPTAIPVLIRPEAAIVAEPAISLTRPQDFTYGTSSSSSLFSFSGINPAVSVSHAWHSAETGITYDTFQIPLEIQVIPEPRAYALLLGVGILGLAAWRRKFTA